MRRIGALVFWSIGVLFLTSGCQKPQASHTTEVRYRDHVVYAEVVSSPDALIQGLSGRDGLPESGGMLFVFPESQPYSFWMKDMKFNLDIIWLQDGKVVDVWRDAPAPSAGQQPAIHRPPGPANEVLEVRAGSAASWGLATGDTLQLKPALDLKAIGR